MQLKKQFPDQKMKCAARNQDMCSSVVDIKLRKIYNKRTFDPFDSILNVFKDEISQNIFLRRRLKTIRNFIQNYFMNNLIFSIFGDTNRYLPVISTLKLKLATLPENKFCNIILAIYQILFEHELW